MITKDGMINSRQRYKCKACNYHFTVTMRKQRFNQGLKRHALILYLSGLSISKIEKIIGVKQTTLFKWVKDLGPKFELMRSAENPRVITMQTSQDRIIKIRDEEWILIYKDGETEIRKK